MRTGCASQEFVAYVLTQVKTEAIPNPLYSSKTQKALEKCFYKLGAKLLWWGTCVSSQDGVTETNLPSSLNNQKLYMSIVFTT